MIKFCLFLGTFLLLGMSPQQELLFNASNKTAISNAALEETAIANEQLSTKRNRLTSVNTPITIVHNSETARQLDEVYELAKQHQSINPINKLVIDFMLPERLSVLSPLEIFDIATLPFLFGSIGTKTITKSATFLGKSKFHKPTYALLKEVEKNRKAIKAAKKAAKLKQSKKYGELLTKHEKLRKEIESLEKLEWAILKTGKKARHILTQTEKKLIELLKTEKEIDDILINWIP